jgi:hypothetical protein
VPNQPEKTPNQREHITFLLILKNMSPFRTQNITLFDLVAKGDPNKENRIELVFLRVIHWIILTILALSIIALTIILQWKGFVPYSGDGTVVFAIVSYLFSIAFIYLAYKWQNVSRWSGYLNTMLLIDIYLSDSRQKLLMNVITSHVFRIWTCLGSIIVFGFLQGVLGANWYVMSPLFVTSGIALIMTYPTEKRLEKWLSWQNISTTAH